MLPRVQSAGTLCHNVLSVEAYGLDVLPDSQP